MIICIYYTWEQFSLDILYVYIYVCVYVFKLFELVKVHSMARLVKLSQTMSDRQVYYMVTRAIRVVMHSLSLLMPLDEWRWTALPTHLSWSSSLVTLNNLNNPNNSGQKQSRCNHSITEVGYSGLPKLFGLFKLPDLLHIHILTYICIYWIYRISISIFFSSYFSRVNIFVYMYICVSRQVEDLNDSKAAEALEMKVTQLVHQQCGESEGGRSHATFLTYLTYVCPLSLSLSCARVLSV